MSTINQVASRGVCECNGGCGIGSGNKLAYSTSRVDPAAGIHGHHLACCMTVGVLLLDGGVRWTT